ncbi:hypothetical protein AJ80_01542 [Polytolypa hystricis UAMH7299]|uniref:Uncharacterized protein n=1 Tax=Polytolypa hystricis (strain UAMH7299) TaxID=1447883 RepID=A0A2B7Z1R9_POLH7|nr:hypothetical protein AJ80_01542 [Polytolypa hystricis UAMH7299]
MGRRKQTRRENPRHVDRWWAWVTEEQATVKAPRMATIDERNILKTRRRAQPMTRYGFPESQGVQKPTERAEVKHQLSHARKPSSTGFKKHTSGLKRSTRRKAKVTPPSDSAPTGDVSVQLSKNTFANFGTSASPDEGCYGIAAGHVVACSTMEKHLLSENELVDCRDTEIKTSHEINTYKEQLAASQLREAQQLRENRLLKRQNDLYATYECRKMAKLTETVKRQEAKHYRELLADYSLKKQQQNPNAAALQKQLDERCGEIEVLRAKLNRALELNSIFANIENDLNELIHPSTTFAAQMRNIILNLNSTADLLACCLIDEQEYLRTSDTRVTDPKLENLIRGTIGNIELQFKHPSLAFRSLLFRLIRDHVFYSDIWIALHFGGYMLRGYQEAMQRIASPDLLARFHKAALYSMIQEDQMFEFEASFVNAHIEELRLDIMSLLGPLMNTETVDEHKIDITRQFNVLLSKALHLRTTCFPPPGKRYEITHYRPSDTFDPETMEPFNALGEPVTVSVDAAPPRIKLCVHGSIVAHSVVEQSSGVEQFKDLSEAFISTCNGQRTARGVTSSDLLGEKAFVILEDETLMKEDGKML